MQNNNMNGMLPFPSTMGGIGGRENNNINNQTLSPPPGYMGDMYSGQVFYSLPISSLSLKNNPMEGETEYFEAYFPPNEPLGLTMQDGILSFTLGNDNNVYKTSVAVIAISKFQVSIRPGDVVISVNNVPIMNYLESQGDTNTSPRLVATRILAEQMDTLQRIRLLRFRDPTSVLVKGSVVRFENAARMIGTGMKPAMAVPPSVQMSGTSLSMIIASTSNQMMEAKLPTVTVNPYRMNDPMSNGMNNIDDDMGSVLTLQSRSQPQQQGQAVGGMMMGQQALMNGVMNMPQEQQQQQQQQQALQQQLLQQEQQLLQQQQQQVLQQQLLQQQQQQQQILQQQILQQQLLQQQQQQQEQQQMLQQQQQQQQQEQERQLQLERQVMMFSGQNPKNPPLAGRPMPYGVGRPMPYSQDEQMRNHMPNGPMNGQMPMSPPGQMIPSPVQVQLLPWEPAGPSKPQSHPPPSEDSVKWGQPRLEQRPWW